jgi:hypothetical protein
MLINKNSIEVNYYYYYYYYYCIILITCGLMPQKFKAVAPKWWLAPKWHVKDRNWRD